MAPSSDSTCISCAICHGPGDGPMFSLGEYYAHVPCVIRRLNELLDPLWEEGCSESPEELVGWLSRGRGS